MLRIFSPRIVSVALLACAVAVAAVAQDTQYPPRASKSLRLTAPSSTTPGAAFRSLLRSLRARRWLLDLEHWRSERRIRTAFDPSRYALPAFQWTQSSFMQHR